MSLHDCSWQPTNPHYPATHSGLYLGVGVHIEELKDEMSTSGDKRCLGRCWTVPRMWGGNCSHSYLRGKVTSGLRMKTVHWPWRSLSKRWEEFQSSGRGTSQWAEKQKRGIEGRAWTTLWEQSCWSRSKQSAPSLIIHLYLERTDRALHSQRFVFFSFFLKDIFEISCSQVISWSGCSIKEPSIWKYRRWISLFCVWFRLC